MGLCVNLFAQTQDSEGSSSCPGEISVEIDVTDFEANLPVGNSSVEVSQTQALLETEVIQGLTDQQGRIKLDLQQPGSYLVQVEADGFSGEQRGLEVECSPPSCASCSQKLSFSLLKSVADDQIRVSLSSPTIQQDMYLVAARAKDNSSCSTDETEENSCPDQVWSGLVKKSHNQGLSFAAKAGGGSPITLFAKFAPHLTEDSVKESSTILTVSDAVSSQEITLQAATYSGETYWLAGCLLLSSNSSDLPFQLIPSNLFLSSSMMETTGSSYCLNQFAIATTTTASETKADDRSFFSSWFF